MTTEENIMDEFIKFQNEIEINGIKLVGELSINIERFSKKIIKNPKAMMYGEPYFDCSESDYKTAVEIETYDIYKVPAYRARKLDKNTFYVYEDQNSEETFFKNKSSHFIGYGTHIL